MYFEYGEKEIEYLKKKDKKLSVAIDKIGLIERKVDSDLFSSVVHHIVGQQISTVAQETIWNRMKDSFGEINSDVFSKLSVEELQSKGITFRKANYIKDFTEKVYSGEFDIKSLKEKSDDEVISELINLKGIGVWTAEMILIFGMQRPNILSFGDLAIHRGMKMLYNHREINRELFDKYKKRYSPYGSVASLYLWRISSGKVEGIEKV